MRAHGKHRNTIWLPSIFVRPQRKLGQIMGLSCFQELASRDLEHLARKLRIG